MTRWNEFIVIRLLCEMTYFLNEQQPTVRSCGDALHASKSSVFVDIKKRMPEFMSLSDNEKLLYLPDRSYLNLISNNNYNRIIDILHINLIERATRGGMATKRRWEKINDTTK